MIPTLGGQGGGRCVQWCRAFPGVRQTDVQQGALGPQRTGDVGGGGGGGPGQELRTFCLPSSSPDGSADGLGLTVALLSGGPNDPTRTGHALASPASAHGMTALLPTARVCLLTLHGLREPHTGKNFQVPDVNIGGQEWGLPQDAGGSWGRSVWAGQETTSSH